MPLRESKQPQNIISLALKAVMPRGKKISNALIVAYFEAKQQLLEMKKDEIKAQILEGFLISECVNIFFEMAIQLNPEPASPKINQKWAQKIAAFGEVFLKKAVNEATDKPIKALEKELIKLLHGELLNLILRGSTNSKPAQVFSCLKLDAVTSSALDAPIAPGAWVSSSIHFSW